MENNKEDPPASETKGEKGDGKRKRKTSVEPRTPLKRARIPVQKFQSPAEEVIPVPSTSKQKLVLELLHKKGSFLGVRGDEGSFYLCKTAQNVFNNTRKFRIQWLDLDQPPDIYKVDFLDTTDADCILTNVKMEKVVKDKFRLPIKEQTRIEDILHKALKKERGEPIEDLVQADESDEDDEDDWEDEPSPKKEKATTQKKSVKETLKAKGSKGKVAKAEKKPEKKKEEKKKGPDRHLKPNSQIKVLEKEPFFETKEKPEFVSKAVHGKLAIRAVLMRDMKLLTSLMEDKERCYKLDGFRSIDQRKTALHYALEMNYHEAIKVLVKDFWGNNNERLKDGSPPTLLISASDRGSYNPRHLGIGAIRPISQSRGGKQGNDAFVMDLDDNPPDCVEYIEDALKLGATKETMDVYMNCNDVEMKEDLMTEAVKNIYLAVLCGNRKLAGRLVEDAMKDCSCGFGYLHKDVLLFDKEELRQTILAASVKKKPWDNKSLTPLHCAAINPNVAYLTRLLSVEPNINLEDRDHRRPIHFAAVCEGVGPLEYLLQRGASPLEVDSQGMTPLHYACSAGRPRNVDILLKKNKEAAQNNEELFKKWGLGCVDKPSRSSYCPIHIAVSYNHADVLKILIKHQVDVNKVLSAGKNKLTSLMMAAGHGSLEITRVLVQNGAFVEKLDKLKRSALMHAVMNGNTHIVSYLLSLGADPNRIDSSENSVVHYAAGYGWICCLKMLLNAGASPSLANFWKTTPVGIAFMKGHIGIVDFLLKQPDVDINFKNDEGLTLMGMAAGSALDAGLVEQIQYLLDRKADPMIRDVNGFNALHQLANNKIVSSDYRSRGVPQEDKMDLTVKIAKLLLKADCDPTSETNSGKTALMLAVEQLNIKLVQLLVEHGGTVTSHKSDGKTILHLMAQQCLKSDLSPILKILVEQKHTVKEEKKVATAAAGAEKAESGEGDKIVENGEKEEAMDVEEAGKVKAPAGEEKVEKGAGDAVNGEVNGMEVDESQADGAKPSGPGASSPGSKAVSASQTDIWPSMAAECDNNGYTPLLLACMEYRDFKKQNGMTDADVKQSSAYGRKFIKALIELASADVSATVQMKTVPEGVKLAENEKYTKDGKMSVLHLLVHVGHEVLEDLDGAGLSTVVAYKPDTEHKDLEGMTALCHAVQGQCVTTLKSLIDAGADVNATFGDEKTTGIQTPLHLAAEEMNAKMVKMLLDAKADAKFINKKTQQSAIHLAVQNRADEAVAIEIAQMLLDAGENVNSGKTTPLHAAVLGNTGSTNASVELEEFLIAKGANLFARDDKGRLPLHYTFITRSKPESTSALDPIELCNMLTDSMGDKELGTQDVEGQSPLHLAAIRGATICCMHLLQRKVSVLAVDNKGFSAVSFAVKNLHDSCAIMLLKSGAKVDDTITIPAKPEKDSQAYYEMPDKTKKPIWTWLPAKILKPQNKDSTFDIYQMAITGELQGVAHMVLDTVGLTGRAVESALKVNKYHIVLRHLHRIKDNNLLTGYTNKDGQNLLHILALRTKPGVDSALQLKVAKILVSKGVSLSRMDKFKRYPLVYVALNHQPKELAKYFIECNPGQDLNQPDLYSRTVMAAYFWDPEKMYDASSKSTRLEYIEMLVKAGASLDVAYTVRCLTYPMFDLVCRQSALDFFTPEDSTEKMTPLISAMYSCDFSLVKFLLQKGASPNMSDHRGVTPIMHAVRINDVDLVKVLLNYSYEQKVDSIDGHPKYGLKKKLSRKLFAIKPSQDMEPVPDSNVDEEEEEADDVNDDGSNIASDDEDAQPENDADSDHDTDVVEDEDEEDDDDSDPRAQHLPLPRLASKLSSLTSQATSQTAEEFQSVEKTSTVNLTAVDNLGMSVVHHVVSPLQYGSYDNEEILYVVAKAGAPLDKPTPSGQTPLQLALSTGAVNLARRLQTLLLVEAEKQENVTFGPFMKEADPFLAKAGASTYEADADLIMKQLLAQAGSELPKVKPKVDRKCMIASSGELVYDSTNKVLYDIVLSKVDVRSLLNDTYNFYKMQIVYHKAKDIYILFTKWGRIGDDGMYQQTPYQKQSEAAVAFEKIFKSKTGNQWSALNDFKIQAKKYRPVLLDKYPTPSIQVNFSLKSTIPSSLSTDVQQLLTELADVRMLQSAMHNKVAEEYMPFGNIKRDVLLQARQLLLKMQDLVTEMDKKKQAFNYDNAEHVTDCETVAALSTEYYSLIPQRGYAFDRIQPLVNLRNVKKQLGLISNLLDLEVASRILLGAQHKLNDCNPFDYIYQAIGCSIQPLREEDVESQYILKYMDSSSDGRKRRVLNIFKLSRPGEEEKLRALNLPNHQLLWHGSSVAHFMSILQKGLLASPPEASIVGQQFGEGIYTSDSFTKSASYCYNSNDKSSMQFALLCEVALGKCMEDCGRSQNVDLLHSEYNSLKVHGKCVPDGDWKLSLPYGVQVPIGHEEDNKWKSPTGEEPYVYYNEYIVQDSSQVCLRYMVQFV